MELLNADNGMSPAWSPDGARIAFLSNRKSGWDLYTMRPDGADLQRLTHGRAPERPAWSADSDWIAFEREKAIEAVPVDGGEIRILLPEAGCGGAPAWAPHDDRLAFAQRGDLYLLPAPDAASERLTAGGADGAPSWSPDGVALAFSRSGAIWTVDVDSAREHRLTEGSEDDEPVWSPDGAAILFVRGGRLWSVAAAGGPPAPLVGLPEPAGSPSYAPGGGAFAFHAYQAGNWEIYVAHPDGSGARSLTQATWVSSRPD